MYPSNVQETFYYMSKHHQCSNIHNVRESTVKINKYVVTTNLFSFLTARWEHSYGSRSCFETISWCSIFLMRKRLTEWEDLSIEVKPKKGEKKMGEESEVKSRRMQKVSKHGRYNFSASKFFLLEKELAL